MTEFLQDPFALYEAQREAATLRHDELLEEYNRLTRRVFNSKKGRRWLLLAMAKHNFMGSVFEDSDAVAAAKRDGFRSFISEILNAAFDGKTPPETDPDDDE